MIQKGKEKDIMVGALVSFSLTQDHDTKLLLFIQDVF